MFIFCLVVCYNRLVIGNDSFFYDYKEERRLLYVAMTRARQKLFMLYVMMDSNWQVCQA